ncbi:MAG: hypothetical protein ACREKS_15400 [Candidatus Rokuibacteriota bacterium]
MLRRKVVNVGFEAIEVIERHPFGLAALGRYPVFPPEFLDFVRRVVPPEHHDTLVHAVVVTAWKGEGP